MDTYIRWHPGAITPLLLRDQFGVHGGCEVSIIPSQFFEDLFRCVNSTQKVVVLKILSGYVFWNTPAVLRGSEELRFHKCKSLKLVGLRGVLLV